MSPKKTKTGLFFGSFNPIHLGHLMIAGYMAEFTDLTAVWFIVSPQNPLKDKRQLLPGLNRLYMANLAVEDEPRFHASTVEFHLPEPSYTVDTVRALRAQHPGKEFVILAGSDILPSLSQWKSNEQLLDLCRFYIYPRKDAETGAFDSHPRMTFVGAPLIGISSSFIREGIRNGRNMQVFLPVKVWNYIEEMGFYR